MGWFMRAGSCLPNRAAQGRNPGFRTARRCSEQVNGIARKGLMARWGRVALRWCRDRRRPVHGAVTSSGSHQEKGCEAVEKALGDGGPNLINTKDATTGDTALHLVTARRDIQWMTFLLYKGSNVNARNEKGVTPLSLAVGLNFVEGVELLRPTAGQDPAPMANR
jgi:ankyrin repeat protein